MYMCMHCKNTDAAQGVVFLIQVERELETISVNPKKGNLELVCASGAIHHRIKLQYPTSNEIAVANDQLHPHAFTNTTSPSKRPSRSYSPARLRTLPDTALPFTKPKRRHTETDIPIHSRPLK